MLAYVIGMLMVGVQVAASYVIGTRYSDGYVCVCMSFCHLPLGANFGPVLTVKFYATCGGILYSMKALGISCHLVSGVLP